jgi:sulfur-carrier protein adenylyltransferase/sulfurtransferase
VEHNISKHLMSRTVNVALVGAGGTGSQVVTALAQMHYALGKLGHPGGFHVTVIDDDHVSEANIGRQWFFPTDLGQYKADVLVNRVNMTMGTQWTSNPSRVTASSYLDFDLVIGAVDTRAARFAIVRAMERAGGGERYYADFGNRAMDGQFILGQVVGTNRKTNGGTLPHVGELFPDVIDPKVVDPDEGPSCSLAEALHKQSLFINRTLVSHGMAIVWELFWKKAITHHGVFVNLATGRTSSLAVDPKAWERFGYGEVKTHYRAHKPPHQKVRAKQGKGHTKPFPTQIIE